MTLLSTTDIFTPATVDDYIAAELSFAETLGLKTTTWQAGGVARTIIAVVANVLYVADTVVSTFAKGAFLSTAANPLVTPEGGPGWLDTLAYEVFDERRTAATFASGSMSLVNASASNYGPFAAGTYHVQNPTTKATYSNVNALTIAASATTTADFIADAAGSASTSAIGTISAAVTTLIGVTVSNPAAFVGLDTQTNAQLVAACKLKLASLTPKTAPHDAYVYFALNADKFLAAGVTLAGGAITRARSDADKTTGVTTVTIANSSGVPAGGDVTKVDGVLQAWCVADSTTCVTQAATALSLTVILDWYIPAAFIAAAGPAVVTALTNAIARIPLGGTIKTPGATTGYVSYDQINAAVIAAIVGVGCPLEQIDTTMTINGGTVDIAMTAYQVTTLNGASVLTEHAV